MKDTKSNIKFTVIIPTRERSDTLEWALKTCTVQDYENFEIIISDNFSQDNTREVVEANKDERIRYINTGQRMSMSSNYEFAISHVTGEYACIIGDDDGLMPNALRDLNEILHGNEIEAVSWKKPIYIWNNHSKPELNNTVCSSLNTSFQKYDAKEMVKELLAFKPDATITFNDLACLYHGFVKMETINRLRMPNGCFFNSMAPDVYATMAISCTVKNLYQTENPYTMHGISGHSTGYASKNSQAVKKFLSETDIPSHPGIKLVPISAPICIADCFLKLQDTFPQARQFELDIMNMTRKAMEDAVLLSAENYQLVVNSVKYTCEFFGIQEHANQIIAQNPNSPNTISINMGYNFFNDYLTVRFDKNVRNIYDATIEYKKLIENNKLGFYISEVSRFLISSIKNYGIRNSLNKGMRRISDRLNSSS